MNKHLARVLVYAKQRNKRVHVTHLTNYKIELDRDSINEMEDKGYINVAGHLDNRTISLTLIGYKEATKLFA